MNAENGLLGEVTILRGLIDAQLGRDMVHGLQANWQADADGLHKLFAQVGPLFNSNRADRLRVIGTLVGHNIDTFVGGRTTRGLTVAELYGLLDWMEGRNIPIQIMKQLRDHPELARRLDLLEKTRVGGTYATPEPEDNGSWDEEAAYPDGLEAPPF